MTNTIKYTMVGLLLGWAITSILLIMVYQRQVDTTIRNYQSEVRIDLATIIRQLEELKRANQNSSKSE